MRIYIQQSGFIRLSSYSKVHIPVYSLVHHYGLSEGNIWSEEPIQSASFTRATHLESVSPRFQIQFFLSPNIQGLLSSTLRRRANLTWLYYYQLFRTLALHSLHQLPLSSRLVP